MKHKALDRSQLTRESKNMFTSCVNQTFRGEPSFGWLPHCFVNNRGKSNESCYHNTNGWIPDIAASTSNTGCTESNSHRYTSYDARSIYANRVAL